MSTTNLLPSLLDVRVRVRASFEIRRQRPPAQPRSAGLDARDPLSTVYRYCTVVLFDFSTNT
jgi:hypothetical protein